MWGYSSIAFKVEIRGKQIRGNQLLKRRNPNNFHFGILQLVSPDMEPNELIYLESSWKERLHMRKPNGRNKRFKEGPFIALIISTRKFTSPVENFLIDVT